MNILTVNAGSSSLRLAFFSIEDSQPVPVADLRYPLDPDQQTEQLQEFLSNHARRVDIIAHRLVHGGDRITGPVIVDTRVERDIEWLALLAPLHNPAALTLIRSCRDELGKDVVQVVVPDTGFYTDLPEVASKYALPGGLCERHQIHRFGFHGLAHQAMMQRWQESAPDLANGGRVISLQLGAGCSVTAINQGIPVDTSMGFTPLEGLVMATRCGDIDAGVLLYLQREAGYSLDDLERLLNHESGLLGLSGKSADMRMLLESNEAAAKLAVDLYCYRARKYVGAYLTVLGGADAILFGGGVGENSALVREKILTGMEWMGIELDSNHNSATHGKAGKISTPESQTEIRVTTVDEGAVMAAEALRAVEETVS
ncbi:MAG: acetate/propionate family kinase [Thiohalobacterales bacterium]